MALINGTNAGETLVGTPDPDSIFGFGGNDIIDGRAGADDMHGGTGDDTYYVENAGDVVDEASGAGLDRVYTELSYALGAGEEVEVLSTRFNSAVTAINLTGNEFANILIGNAGANRLFGGAGADDLRGLAGNDIYYVDHAGDIVREGGGGGTDTVYAEASYTLAAGQEVEVLSTRFNAAVTAINLTGNEFGQVLIGDAGANRLFGGGGADDLRGLAGNDIYYVDHVGDIVRESAGGGTDTVYAETSYTLASGQEIEVLSTRFNAATTAINLTGNALANILIGNAGANRLFGGGGADDLRGLAGNDIYYVDHVGDIVRENAGGGIDTVYAETSYTLATGQEIEVLSTRFNAATTAINLTGNNLANILIGNAGANALIGGGGNDDLRGLGGGDTYYVDMAGDVVREGAGGGTDTVYAETSYALLAGQEIEVLSTRFNAAATAINLTGNEFGQVLIGNAGVNVLDGKGGNDDLRGLAGADTFAFTTTLGAGNVDLVQGFVAGSDRILLGGTSGQPFTAMASQTVRSGAFVIGTAALQADDVLIYNSATGALLYDADGSGAGAAVQFATLDAGLGLTAADFIVSGPANAAPAITSAGTASVAENSAASTVVYQAAATDANGDRITYSLTGADAGLLTIDAVTGAVRLVSPANFEAKSLYSFNVVASDSGSSTVKGVALTITDVSDGTPIIAEAAAPNNDRFSAQAIDRGDLVVAPHPNLHNDDLPSGTIDGSISAPTDLDFFSITLQAGELLILDVDGTSGGLDSHLRLFQANGTEIGDNDDLVSFDPGSAPPFGHNTDSQIRFRAATGGTYYFSIEAFDGLSDGDYLLHVSIGPPVGAAQIIEEDVEALVSGAEWNHLALSYGFPTLETQYPAGIEETDEPGEFAPFTAFQQASTVQLLQLIANVSSLTFSAAANPGQADLRFAMSDQADVAYAYYPTNNGADSLGGSAWFNKVDFNDPQKGNYAWMGILHEAGHALGLKHGHEFPVAISADRDSVEYSVMTYRSFPGQSLAGGGGYTNEEWGFAQTLMMYDIAALQQMYGANFTLNATSTVYSWNPGTGEMSLNGVGQGAPGNGDAATLASENRVFMTVWDGGGDDTYNLSSYTTSVLIDLRPGEWTRTSSAQLANLGGGHVARGNVANALQFGNDPRSLIENAIGGSGDDVLIANQAANHLTGNAGGDTFRWTSSAHSGVGALADTVADFDVNETDRIDLATIDANPATGGDDAFSFLGTGAFTNAAGQVRYDVIGGHAHVYADLNGDAVADMEIVLSNVTFLGGGEFTF